jgi:inner membrane protein
MPSPVGHTIAGLCGYVLLARGVVPRHRMKLLLASVVLSNLPDIDFLPGLFWGSLGMFHRQATHSLVAALVSGLLVGILMKKRNFPAWPWGLWAFSLYLSHIFLDMLIDSSRGVQFLWPFSRSYLSFPIAIFKGFDYSASSALGTIQVLFSFNNLLTVLWEIALMLPFVWLATIYAKRISKFSKLMGLE